MGIRGATREEIDQKKRAKIHILAVLISCWQIMSLRITLRYEIPGFAFIGLVVLLIWKPVVETFVGFNIPSSVIVAFVTFISGPPFGFLITQLWYVLFHKFWYWERKTDEDPLKTFVGYGVVNDPKKARIALNYLSRKYEKPARIFLFRRVNLYHAICSTFLALVLGFGFGYLLRIFLRVTIPILRPYRLWNWWDYTQLTTWVSFAIILLVLWWSKSSVSREISEMQLFIVRKIKDKISELPKEYLQPDRKIKRKK